MLHIPIRRFSWLSLPALLVLTGCPDLSAVKQFAGLSSSVTDNQQVISDYIDSPKRQRLYEPDSQHATLDAIAAKRAQQQARFTAVQSTLVAYMKALQNLASDEAVSLDDDIDELKNALDSSKFIGDADSAKNKETSSAAATIAKVLAKAGLDQWRKSKLKQLIQDTNPAIQTAIAGFVEILNVDLRNSLLNEKAAVTKPFNGWKASAVDACLKVAKKQDPGTPEAALRSDCKKDAEPVVADIFTQERVAVLTKKEQALDYYIRSLQTIAIGHQHLTHNLDKIDKDTVVAQIQSYSKTIETLRKAILTLSK